MSMYVNSFLYCSLNRSFKAASVSGYPPGIVLLLLRTTADHQGFVMVSFGCVTCFVVCTSHRLSKHIASLSHDKLQQHPHSNTAPPGLLRRTLISTVALTHEKYIKQRSSPTAPSHAVSSPSTKQAREECRLGKNDQKMNYF